MPFVRERPTNGLRSKCISTLPMFIVISSIYYKLVVFNIVDLLNNWEDYTSSANADLISA